MEIEGKYFALLILLLIVAIYIAYTQYSRNGVLTEYFADTAKKRKKKIEKEDD